MNDACLKTRVLCANRAVPRYTSYPTAPHFMPGFTDGQYGAWLSALGPAQSLSLYVHVPFCPKLCWFCGCNTKITQREAPVAEYAGFLKREAALLAARLPAGLEVAHLHFGGGSPTILGPALFEDLIGHLRGLFKFSDGAEVAVEVDPRNFTEALAATYAACGVNRLSFGVQDFDEKVMTAINRPQIFPVVYRAVEMARTYGIAGINIDLMYGLPHQSVKSMARMVERAVFLKPDRIALFGYAHVPWMKKHMRLIPEEALPDNDLRYDLFETAARGFEEAGYIGVGIDHFARPGDALVGAYESGKMRRNFQGYTDDAGDVLLGLGSSAISRLPQGYVQNAVHAPQYRDRVESGVLPVEKFRAFSAEDLCRAEVIEQLICFMRADTVAIAARHGFDASLFAEALGRLKPLEALHLVEVSDDGAVRVLSRLAARLACAAFDAYIKPSPDEVLRHVSAI